VRTVFLLLILFWAGQKASSAQTCPLTIRGNIQPRSTIVEWTTKSESQDYDLERVSIFEGPILNNPTEPDAELKPLEKNGTQFWAFGAPIGKREVWMRCEYAHSAFALSRQVFPDTALCFQRTEIGSRKAVKNRVVVMCVNASHKANETLRPYQAR
jgi:hypothetical protein